MLDSQPCDIIFLSLFPFKKFTDFNNKSINDKNWIFKLIVIFVIGGARYKQHADRLDDSLSISP